MTKKETKTSKAGPFIYQIKVTLEAIQSPGHEEHERMLEWIGGSFDPEAFDLDEINRKLKRIK